ncbi:MAG: glycogen/starch synthase, partial [Gammaproteobacteria bacterium]|nr:glycogen/starch synthase [Gammaproteobacteria bacterium]
MAKILFATSEAFPLIKTGGLGDVSGSLPAALRALGEEIQLILPAYLPVKQRLGKCKEIASFTIPATGDE